MKAARRTRPLPARTPTLVGLPPPLHLPAEPNADDAIIVDVEVNAAGQIEIVGASRVT